jgi:pimeloyl-ACP methyl ester carboxylesterase
MSWRRKWNRNLSHVVDEITIYLVNRFQHRHYEQASTAEEVKVYLENWIGKCHNTFYCPAEIDLVLDLKKGKEFRFSFLTPLPCEFEENHRVVADFFCGGEDWQRPVMFLWHGLMSASDRGYRKWARRMTQRGWHVVFFHLPYHYQRKPHGYFNGELAVGPNGIRTVQTIRQAVTEARSLACWLKKQGVTKIGCWGMSYGGWVAGLMAAVEPMVHCALLLEPITDFEHAIWESPVSAALRHHMGQRGVTREMARVLDHLVSPRFMKPLCSPENLVLLAAEWDRITPAAHIEALAKAWNCPNYICCPQGHVGYQLMPEAFRQWQTRFA